MIWHRSPPPVQPAGVCLVYGDGTEARVTVMVYDGRRGRQHIWRALNPRPNALPTTMRVALLPPRTTIVVE